MDNNRAKFNGSSIVHKKKVATTKQAQEDAIQNRFGVCYIEFLISIHCLGLLSGNLVFHKTRSDLLIRKQVSKGVIISWGSGV